MFRQDIRQKLSWFWQSRKAAAEAGLEWGSKELDWSTPNVSTVLKEASSVSDAILDESEEHKVNLVVLGNKGKTATERFLLGSVTNHIARRANCSVWIIRKKLAS